MTKEQQRIAIAEARGYIRQGPDSPWFDSPDNEQIHIEDLPDCPNDLNAMHEAEKTRFNDGNDWADYFDALQEICWDQNDPITATAAQRAEAFLKTLNLWIP